MARRLYVVAVLCVALLVGSVAVAVPASPLASELRASVEALTAPELAGRRSGTDGGTRAAALIASWLRDAGLAPGGDVGTFFQSFAVGRGLALGPRNELRAGGQTLAIATEWTPHGGSPTAAVHGRLVFAGYGLGDDGGRDDYAGLDARDAVVIILDGAPPGRRATRLEKLLTARHRGARAALIVVPALPTLDATRAPVDLVSASVTPAAADALLTPAGCTLADLQRAHAAGAPATLARDVDVELRVDVVAQPRRAANVIGVLRGRDPALADEAIVLGAHYDHLGVVAGVVHPGADDNASGTSVVVSLARAFAAAGAAPRTLIFSLFGAEELGLIGSRYYVEHPAVSLEHTIAMLNFDMVGRLHDGQLRIAGVDSGSRLRTVVADAARVAGVPVDLRSSPYSASDHSRFYAAHAPVLFFFTGAHEDYHRPSDTVDKIDADGMARVAAVAADVVMRLARGDRPLYAAVPRPERAARERKRRGGGGAFLGVGGDVSESDGAAITHVVPGSAAARAGLRDGDVIVRLGGAPVDSFDDLRAAIRRHAVGDTVELTYLRDGHDFATSATLERSHE